MSPKSLVVICVAATVILSLAFASPAGAQGQATTRAGSDCVAGFADLYNAIEPVELSKYEETTVAFIWEQEKMARDVYTELAARWRMPIFSNIASAEQNHMNMVSKLFETYGVEDSFTELPPGIFDNQELAGLKIELVEKGEDSLVKALQVGAEIEEKGLDDLGELLDNTYNGHVKLVAENLAKGSRNHLRAFMGALDAQDETYEPQHLDPGEFFLILDRDRETGLVDAEGEPVDSCAEGEVDSGQWHGGGDRPTPHG
ncbi:MAG: DUF2202 domain-containing protein [Planctomycetota bacterium]|jgi:hypothetical protein